MLNQIGAIASLGSVALSRSAQLIVGSTAHHIRVMPKRSQLPYRANENSRPFDAQFRMDAATSPVTPQQNNVIVDQGRQWIVWRIIPSSAGSHWVLECMAPATVGIVPVRRTMTPDGMGGHTYHWEGLPVAIFYGKIKEANSERQLTAETASAIGRLRMSYQADTVPADFSESWRVEVDGRTYEILSVTNDDENPQWRNAVLAREQNE